jgi:monoamine oxidase
MAVAVIGSGLTGAIVSAVCRKLLGPSVNISVFEKARGAGGRTSTRRRNGAQYDIGCPNVEMSDNVRKFLSMPCVLKPVVSISDEADLASNSYVAVGCVFLLFLSIPGLFLY